MSCSDLLPNHGVEMILDDSCTRVCIRKSYETAREQLKCRRNAPTKVSVK